MKFFMGRKRKDSGRTMMDAIHETKKASSSMTYPRGTCFSFDLDIIQNTILTDEAKRDAIKDFNGKWRQGKYEVKKKNFSPYEDDEEMLKELSQDLVPPEQ
ncbi:hypothetical protein BUALT_Bualt03G0198500 [Buddleja alternifolia]|uniref:Uncharacterized protein n=1 Tax=Buddleja alternifolia TaxID=168488 RepID=A0AAV6XZL2_9LAMI|nr:hypothetical protein BUALT_Bualt03G0198500 [Buddleja alternifolia]